MTERSGKSGTVALDVRAALKEAISRLRAGNVPSHTLAAELLLMHTIGRDRAWVYSHPEAVLEPMAIEKYFSLVERRAGGEPVQYITGKQEFWGLEFEVTPAVLIPRPETEHIVEVALERLGARGIKVRLDTGAPSDPLRIADLGTGSGCLAVALAHELPHAEVFATDISAEALEVARRNAERLGAASQVHFVRCDLLSTFLVYRSQPLDLIVSNPPYVGRCETDTLPREVREHEPGVALFGGVTGIEIYRRLIEQAGSLLRTGGILVLEIGYSAADHVLGILRAGPSWGNIGVTNDLRGIPRVIAAEHIAPAAGSSYDSRQNIRGRMS